MEINRKKHNMLALVFVNFESKINNKKKKQKQLRFKGGNKKGKIKQ